MSKLSVFLVFGLLFVPSIVFAAYTKCYVLQGGTVCLNATTISSPYGNITMNSTANNYPTNLTVNQTGSSYSVVLGRFGLGSLMGNFTVSSSNASGGGIGYVNTTGANFNSTNWFIRMINDTTAQAAGVSCNAGDAISTLSNNSVCTSFITPAALSAFGYISSAPNVNITNYTASGSTTSIYLSNGTIYNATTTGGSGTGNATANGTANYVARFTNGTNIATGSIYDNGTSIAIGTTTNSGILRIESGSGTSNANEVYLVSTQNVPDSAGTVYRSNLNFYIRNTTNGENRGLGISVHEQDSTGAHPNHVTFYSSFTNTSSSQRAFQWQWGNSTDGKFQLVDLGILKFPENWSYYNGTNVNSTEIQAQSNTFNIITDWGDSSLTEELGIYRNEVLDANRWVKLNNTMASFNKAVVIGSNDENTSKLAVNGNASISGNTQFGDGAVYINTASNSTGFGTRSPSGSGIDIQQATQSSSLPTTISTYAIRTKAATTTGNYIGMISVAESSTAQAGMLAYDSGSGGRQELLFTSTNSTGNVNEVIRISSNKELGINTSDPNSTFHVVGDSNVTGVTYTSILFVNNTQVCLSNGTNCPVGGSGNVTASNGTAGFVGVFSSASNLVAMLINSTMIGDAAINATHLYTSNTGSAGQVLTLNSTGGMNWSTPSTGSSSGGNASYIGDGVTRSVAMVYNSTAYNSTPSVNITSNGTIKITDAIFDNTVSFANQTQARCAINYTIGLSQTQGRWTTPVDSMTSCLPNPVTNTILNTTTCNSSQSIPIPFDGYLRRAFIMVQTNGTLSSNQNTTYEVYVNGVATGLNGNITMVTRYNATNITNINQRVQFGDYVNIRATYPAWTTNPTQIDQKIGVEISKC